ncbi:MAG: hypothetical protein V7745_04155 [Pseudomonadales bacterium]
MNSELQKCLRGHLDSLARQGETISYRQLAMLAEVSSPMAIRRLALALEEVIREDDAAGIFPSVACLAVSQADPAIPRAGFFMLLRELDLYSGTDEGPEAEIFHADCVQQVFQRFSLTD